MSLRHPPHDPLTLLALFVGTFAVASCATDGATDFMAQSDQALTSNENKMQPGDAGCDDVTGTDQAACVHGRKAFHDRKLQALGGNGRACSDCHSPSDELQLSPAEAEARFQKMLATGEDDPLFRPIDANDFRVNGANASDFTNLRFGLIRITFNLPPQVALIDPVTNLPSAERSVDVWRSVPSVKDVAITGPDSFGRTGDNGGAPIGPNPSGGYQLDGRAANLDDQALGALRSHAEIQNDPPAELLSNIAAFQKSLFTSPSVANLAAAMTAGSTDLPDPDPALTALETAGKSTFNRVCATCHGSTGHPSTTSPTIGQRYHRIRSQCPRPPVRPADDGFGALQLPPCPSVVTANARTYEFTAPNGNKQRFTADDLGRAFFTGRFPDAPAFDAPNVRGSSKTAPYFHNNSVASIEELVEFYRVLFIAIRRDFAPPNLPPVISSDGTTFDRFITTDEVPGLVAYLKKI